jgi:hypothetical protein
VFGGLYLPHLRRAIHGHLARAEFLLRDGAVDVSREDWDLDGTEEVLLSSGGQFLSIHPAQGGSIPVWYLDRAALNLADSITRAPEPYHARIRGEEGRPAGAKLADQFSGSDPGLAAALVYDAVPRTSGLVWWFPDGTDRSEWLRDRPMERWVGGSWEVLSVRRGQVPSCELRVERDGLVFRRGLKISTTGEVELIVLLENPGPRERSGTVGVEWMVNLLAGDAPDRWLETGDGIRHRLGTRGESVGPVDIADEWLGLGLRLDAGGDSALAWEGVHTVNQSVGGYEKVYQGTSFLQTGPVVVPAGGVAQFRAVLEIRQPDVPSPL